MYGTQKYLLLSIKLHPDEFTLVGEGVRRRRSRSPYLELHRTREGFLGM